MPGTNASSPLACRYPVRMAVVDLDDAPSWFAPQARDHMTADEARRMAGTEGRVTAHCSVPNLPCSFLTESMHPLLAAMQD